MKVIDLKGHQEVKFIQEAVLIVVSFNLFCCFQILIDVKLFNIGGIITDTQHGQKFVPLPYNYDHDIVNPGSLTVLVGESNKNFININKRNK